MQPFIFFFGVTFGVMLGAKGALVMAKRYQPPPANITTVADILACKERLKMYQLNITDDTAFVYDDNKLIGATLCDKGGIDSVIFKNNE